MKQRTHYRAVFLSDFHLGFRGCKAKQLLSFLKSIECDYLYLIGDIFDMFAMRNKVWWNPDCTAVLRRLLKMAKFGTKIIYLIGNHDAPIRHFIPMSFGDEIEIADEVFHWTSSGHKYVILHGDVFDFVPKWLTILGSHLYDKIVMVSSVLHHTRMAMGFKRYWSLAGFLKNKTKKALSAIKSYEAAVTQYARHKECYGAITGHIHNAIITRENGIEYVNCGDWIESLSAVVELEDGSLELIHWHDMTKEGIDDPIALVA